MSCSYVSYLILGFAVPTSAIRIPAYHRGCDHEETDKNYCAECGAPTRVKGFTVKDLPRVGRKSLREGTIPIGVLPMEGPEISGIVGALFAGTSTGETMVVKDIEQLHLARIGVEQFCLKWDIPFKPENIQLHLVSYWE